MLRLSLNLPRYRFDLHIVKQRRDPNSPKIIPSLSAIKNTRKGTKLSRFFRHVFEHKTIKRLLGSNLAIAIAVTTLYPPTQTLASSDAGNQVIAVQKVEFSTHQGVVYPVNTIKITQGYSFFHPGVDLDGITGDPINPVMVGKVKLIQHSNFGYGNAVQVDHGNGLTTLYAHLSKIYVTEGQEVVQDTVLGAMGATGHASGDHLHFEVWQDSTRLNPFSILPRNR